MTNDQDAREKAAIQFIRDWPSGVSYHRNDMTCPYEQGWLAALEGPAVQELVSALNKIGILGMSELAYTSEFTERTNQIVRQALEAFRQARGEK